MRGPIDDVIVLSSTNSSGNYPFYRVLSTYIRTYNAFRKYSVSSSKLSQIEDNKRDETTRITTTKIQQDYTLRYIISRHWLIKQVITVIAVNMPHHFRNLLVHRTRFELPRNLIITQIHRIFVMSSVLQTPTPAAAEEEKWEIHHWSFCETRFSIHLCVNTECSESGSAPQARWWRWSFPQHRSLVELFEETGCLSGDCSTLMVDTRVVVRGSPEYRELGQLWPAGVFSVAEHESMSSLSFRAMRKPFSPHHSTLDFPTCDGFVESSGLHPYFRDRIIICWYHITYVKRKIEARIIE